MMKFFKEYWCYIIVIVVSMSSVLYALHNTNAPKIETRRCSFEKMSNNIDNALITTVKFSTKKVDFGIVPADTVLKAIFILHNTGEQCLKIESVNPDCSCTDYLLSKEIVEVGDSALLALIYNTKDKIGEQELQTIVKMNTREKFYKITLKADIE